MTWGRAPNQRLPRDVVYETMVRHLPGEHHERLCETFVRWGRFGNLFAYDDASQSFFPADLG